MKCLVQFSTGVGSAEVAYRAVAQYGVDNVVLLTANTRVEDADNWRFATYVWQAIGEPRWRVLTDGRTPMQVGRALRVVPNNRMAVCSRVLKRELLRTYIDKHYDPGTDVVSVGFDWMEEHRLTAARPLWKPWRIEAPLMEEPKLDKRQLLDLMRSRGIEPPRLYELNLPHANCGGACVRGGQAAWRTLLGWNRARYLEWERDEELIRADLGKDVSILRDRTFDRTRPLSLRAFRERLDAQPSMFDAEDWGACGCL